MADRSNRSKTLATPSLAEILLNQGLLAEARAMLRRMAEERPGDPRVAMLTKRLEERADAGDPLQEPVLGIGRDAMTLVVAGKDLELRWEMTETGLNIARRQARYSGVLVARLFTVTTGSRGVRRSFRDIELRHPCGSLRLAGLPRPAVHVAAAGFLALSGLFVPLATSRPVEGTEA